MSDFFQNGTVTTFHNLTDRSVEELDNDLMKFSQTNRLGLILPSLYSELEAPALDNIVTELAKVPYLSQIVIGLDRADQAQFEHAKDYFSRLDQNHRILWNDGPRLQKVMSRLQDLGLAPTEPGKGTNVWWRCMIVILLLTHGIYLQNSSTRSRTPPSILPSQKVTTPGTPKVN
jgi:glucosyl-3-phosphoglycerate synthase